MGILEKYNELKKDNPNLDNDMVMTFIEEMPTEAIILFDQMKYGNHIIDEEFYEKAVNLLEWIDEKGKGAKWEVNDIIKLSGINFDEKDYYPLDFCYAVNWLYSDNCNVIQDPSTYLKMAVNLLEDNDNWVDTSERAYCNAKERIKHNS